MADGELQELARLGPFGGLDTTSDPDYVQPTNAVDMTNFDPTRKYGAFSVILGRTKNFVTAFPNALKNIGTFVNKSGNNPPVISVVGQMSSNPWTLSIADAGGAPIAISIPYAAGGAASKMRFCQYAGYLFMTPSNAGDVPLKISSTNRTVATYWQIAPPVSNAPNVSPGAVGTALNGTYQWCTTYLNSSTGQESSHSPATGVLNFSGNASATLSFPNGYGSTDPQVDKINIYRVGGGSSVWTLVGTIANVANPPNFVDTTPDNGLTGQSLVLHRDPPALFVSFTIHKERMWGFGYLVNYQWTFGQSNTYGQTPPQPSDLWFTRYGEPWSFDAVNNVIPLGRDNAGDVGVAIVSLSSVVVALKSFSIWVIYGDSEQDFRAVKVLDTPGCVNADTVGVGHGYVFWVSASKHVWMFDGGTATNISRGDPQKGGIRETLRANTNGFSGWVGSVYDESYFLSDPSTGVTYAYHIPTGVWYKLGFAALLFAVLSEVPLMLAVPSGSNTAIDQWFAKEVDDYGALTASWTSGNFVKDPKVRYHYRFVIVRIPPSDPANQIVVTLYVDGVQAVQATLTPRAASSLNRGLSYYRLSIPSAFARGYSCATTVSATKANATSPVVSSISVYGFAVSEFDIAVPPNGST